MRFARAAAVPALLIALVGCQGPFNSLTVSGLSASQNFFARTVPDVNDCRGSGRVKVQPCPVTLTTKHQMRVVTVSGPNVTDSAVIETACEKKHICTVGQISSKPVDWYVYSATKCGSADIYFYGYNQSGGTVGIGHLEVINKDC